MGFRIVFYSMGGWSNDSHTLPGSWVPVLRPVCREGGGGVIRYTVHTYSACNWDRGVMISGVNATGMVEPDQPLPIHCVYLEGGIP